jgi:P-type Ca2+ transporter type 2C
MLMLLVSTGIVYLLIGDLREAIAILASIMVVIGISITQKQRTERTLEALRDLTSPRALVIRAEGTRRIPAREVVPGDIVILNEGDRVPSDGRVVESVLLALDESLLTGESFPVEKRAVIEGVPQNTIDTIGAVYSGTLVVRGHGISIVTATGAQSEIGKIGGQLGGVVSELTKLERETAKLVRTFGIVSLLVCVFVAGNVWSLARRLDQGGDLSSGAGHLHGSGRVSCCSDHISGHWRLANFAEKGTYAPISCDRNAWGSDRDLCR